MEFSALLRQPKSRTRDEKLAYVDEVLELMDMELYADAIVGVPGEGLNVEQRKRLTIAVEMVAQPELLLFVGKRAFHEVLQDVSSLELTLLDEPTSGLDSQTAWSICTLLRKLTDNGQSILCTIHQPSFQLFTMFDRLLLLGSGGETLYFGDIGHDASTLINYFEMNGAGQCKSGDNPAEWMLDITNSSTASETQKGSSQIDWIQKWNASSQKQDMLGQLNTLRPDHSNIGQLAKAPHEAYATSLTRQIILLSKRTFIDQWRSPVYLFAKVVVSIGTVSHCSTMSLEWRIRVPADSL